MASLEAKKPKPAGNPPYTVGAEWPDVLLAKVVSHWHPHRILRVVMRALITQDAFCQCLGYLLGRWWFVYSRYSVPQPIERRLRACWLPLLRGEQVASAKSYECAFGDGYESANKLSEAGFKRQVAGVRAQGFVWIEEISTALLEAWEWRVRPKDGSPESKSSRHYQALVEERLSFYYDKDRQISNVRAMTMHEYLNLLPLPHRPSSDDHMVRMHDEGIGAWMQLAHYVLFAQRAHVFVIDSNGLIHIGADCLYVEACLRTRRRVPAACA